MVCSTDPNVSVRMTEIILGRAPPYRHNKSFNLQTKFSTDTNFLQCDDKPLSIVAESKKLAILSLFHKVLHKLDS